eukprot:361557-Chlamydomonas_euryale.AAC.4
MRIAVSLRAACAHAHARARFSHVCIQRPAVRASMDAGACFYAFDEQGELYVLMVREDVDVTLKAGEWEELAEVRTNMQPRRVARVWGGTW